VDEDWRIWKMIIIRLKKTLVIGIISIILLASFPIVMSGENILTKEIANKNPSINGDIEFSVFGFMRFFVLVKNNRDEQITVYVNYTMWLSKYGANSTINPFIVKPNSFNFIYWDCQPMPLYYTKIIIEAGGLNFTKYGFTILGFNFFY
jgi:hypothetical protein